MSAAKYDKQKEAIQLRKELGLSIGEISLRLNVAKSSVSKWMSGVSFNEREIEIINERRKIRGGEGAKWIVTNALNTRRDSQNFGREQSKEMLPLHIMGCMLYWAEGSKNRNQVAFSNSDKDMIALFMRFLRESMFVADDKIKIAINCYCNNGLSVEDIENHWLSVTRLTRDRLFKTTINAVPSSRTTMGIHRLPYGVCRIVVGSTDILQRIYGSIQEYAKIDRPEWIV